MGNSQHRPSTKPTTNGNAARSNGARMNARVISSLMIMHQTLYMGCNPHRIAGLLPKIELKGTS
jgi:hypothetical protein